MKRLIFLTVLLFISYGTALSQENTTDLIGFWEDSKNKITYEFKPDSSIMFYQSGQGVFVNSYTLDMTKDPGWIDFTIGNGNRKMVIQSLIKIIDKNTIWIEQGAPVGPHPTAFSNPDESGMVRIHVLYRKVE